MSEPDDGELLAIAQEAAQAAAAVLVEYQGRVAGAVQTKSTPTDPVTEADVAAEEAIRRVISGKRPDDSVVGEEGDERAGSSGLRWVVDPLDGTVNYIYGNPLWCVSVACDGHAGVVYDPVADECFTAQAQGPPELNGEAIAPTMVTELDRCLLATGFGYDAEVRRGQAETVARLLPLVRDIRRGGSAALDLAWLAAGRCDAYFERGVKEWDVAAGRIICRAAGLEFRELEPAGGQPAGVMACAPGLADELQALLA
ncbi:MAG: inositol monophosphatase family protein [Solirubrobacterales bacterium]